MYYTNNKAIKNYIPNYLINSSTYYVVVTDLEGKYSFYNETFIRKFSFLGENLLGNPFDVTVDPKDVEKCNQAALDCITNPGKVVSLFVRKPENSKEETFYLTSWNFSLLQDSKGEPLGIICVGHDITETEKSAKLAKKFEEDFIKVINEIEDGFFAFNFEWECIQINEAACKLIGREKEELIGKEIWEVFPEEDTQNFKKAMQEQFVLQFEDYVPSTDSYYWIVAYPSPYGINVFYRDITKEKKANIALQESERKLKALVDSTNSANILLDTKGNILSCNKAAESFVRLLYGKNLKIGEDIKHFIDKRQMSILNEFFLKALEGDHLLVDIELFFDNSTHGLWFEIECSPAHDSEGNLFGVSFNASNIDEKKRTYEKLKAQNQELEKIAFMQSHSLRKSIVNILDLLYLIEDNYGSDVPDNLQTYLEQLRQIAIDADDTLHDIAVQLNKMLG